MTDLCGADAVTLAGMLRRREVSAREVMAAHIQRIEAVDGGVNAMDGGVSAVDSGVNAVVTRTFDAALARAARADEALARGAEPGPLHGLPVAHKDLHDTAGVRTTYGSVLFADHVPDHDALVVHRMSQAGAISLGKTNTPEFGAGSHTVNPVFGATRNPYDLTRSAGGSSGGAAAALAARMISLADGSDLGGSLRNPAGFCNVVGLRPSPGRVPSWPVTDVADVLGVEGPMGRTVADVALLLSVLAGPDPRVPLALDAPAPQIRPDQVPGLLARDLRGVRVAWSADLGLPVEPAVRDVLAPARQVLEDLGCEVTDAAPDLTGADEVFRTRRAFRFLTAFGPLLRRHPGQLGPNVTWNTERGLELSVADLSRATVLHAARRRAGQRVLRVGRRARLPGHPGRPVRRHAGLGARHRRPAAAHLPGLDGVGLPDLGDRAPGHFRARRVHPGRPAGRAPAGRPPPGGLAAAPGGARLRGRHRARPGHPARARVTRAPLTRAPLTRAPLTRPR